MYLVVSDGNSLNVFFFLDLVQPLIQVYPSNITSEGESLILTCVVEGYPFVRCKWLKDGKDFTDNCTNFDIEKAIRKNAGRYECMAWNTYRTKTSYPLLIDVHCKLYF